MPGQRMAPHTPQESPKVKTKCFRVGWCRLYAPMVPLAPHPCVRWWNTEEMPLKLTRLCLHSLRGGSSHQKPSYPVGRVSPPARLASLPKTTRSGGVDSNEQVTVFQPLNGSGAKGTMGRSNPGRRKQKDTLKSFTRGISYQHNANARLYRTSSRFPLVYLFFFGVQNHFFFCQQKKKWFWPLPGRQKPTQSKNISLSHKRKGRFPRQGIRPIRISPHENTPPSRHAPNRNLSGQRTTHV